LGLIAQVSMTANRTFPLQVQSSSSSCFSANVPDTLWLWHFRYGHLSLGGLSTLQRKNMVSGLPQVETHSQVCEECAVGKQQRNQFPKGKSWRAKNVLELVHYDLCCPINPSSNGGQRYIITFIDDFSQKTWVYILQVKSDAFEAFKSLKIMIEKEAGS